MPKRPFDAQRRRPPADQILGGQPVPDGAVDRRRQPVGGDVAGEVDERAGRAGDREAVLLLAIERRQLGRGVDDDADAPDVATARQDEVQRLVEDEAVEAVERGRRRSGDPAGFADVEHERAQAVAQVDVARQPEGVGAVLVEDAALDPATELAVGEPGGLRLAPGHRPQLTCGDRLQAAVGIGHAATRPQGCDITRRVQCARTGPIRVCSLTQSGRPFSVREDDRSASVRSR